jgi:hypothetical protein
MLAVLFLALAAASPAPSAASKASPGASKPSGASKPLDPAAHARAIAKELPWARDAMFEVRREAGKIQDPALRAAVEAQILAPWLPRETWALSHLDEARKLLGEPELLLPAPGKGDFAAAPGGPCEDGHHGYPGGLGVHTLANLLHGRALAAVYQHVYGTELSNDALAAAAIWHDSMKSATLPWKDDGSCGPEAKIAGTPAHHVLGLAAAFSRHLPKELIFVIGSAHAPDLAQVCKWVKAASIIALGQDTDCLQRLPAEAFVNHFSDADFPFTVNAWTSYAAKAPKGWERYDALRQDGNDVAFYARTH